MRRVVIVLWITQCLIRHWRWAVLVGGYYWLVEYTKHVQGWPL